MSTVNEAVSSSSTRSTHKTGEEEAYFVYASSPRESEMNGYLVSTVNEVVSSSSTPSYTNRKLDVAHSPIHSS